MFERFRNIFSGREEREGEEINLEPGEVLDFYREEREPELREVEKRIEEFRAGFEEELDELEGHLEELRDFSDEHPTVEDVSTNVAEERLRMIERLDIPESGPEIRSEVGGFVEDFRAVSQKEKAVLDRIGGPVKEAFGAVDRISSRVDELENFLKNDYGVVESLEELERLVEEWRGGKQEANELEEWMEGIDTEGPRERMEKLERELEKLEEDPEQEEKERLEAKIAAVEGEREKLRKRAESAAGDMQRGLKKLLYAARNGDVELASEHIEPLEVVRERDILEEDISTERIGAAVDAAQKAIESLDLGERQRKKFSVGAARLKDLSETRERLDEIGEELESLESRLEELDIDDRREELEGERERAEELLAERAEERNRLRKELREERSRLEEKVRKMEELLESELSHDIDVLGG